MRIDSVRISLFVSYVSCWNFDPGSRPWDFYFWTYFLDEQIVRKSCLFQVKFTRLLSTLLKWRTFITLVVQIVNYREKMKLLVSKGLRWTYMSVSTATYLMGRLGRFAFTKILELTDIDFLRKNFLGTLFILLEIRLIYWNLKNWQCKFRQSLRLSIR